jgi:O-6-methylguanine DNA methyltransferase
VTKTTDHDVIAQLQGLQDSAPDGLRDRILGAVELGEFATTIQGPTDSLWIVYTTRGISGVAPRRVAGDVDELSAHVGRPLAAKALPARLRASLERALRTGKVGALPLDLRHLTEFQQTVLKKAAEIPPGEMRPYRWVAREIGRPKAVRAVGTALAKNPIPILLPCHRVSRSDGGIGNYAFGPSMKRALLAAEGLDVDVVDDAVTRGVRYIGSRHTDIYCHPTCRHARRIRAGNREEFASAADAAASGRHPCAVCRPMAA